MRIPDGSSSTDGDDALDDGLRAAFVPVSDAGRPRVREIVARIAGSAPQVNLRGPDFEHTPIVDANSPEARSLPLGRGSYQILGEIARGGMGVILRGHDQDLGRDIAMKVLHKDLSRRADILQRFVEEAQIGGQLQHPGVVPVYELGLMADERPYFTMKLVKGRTLAALLAERPKPDLDRRKLLEVFEAVCQTVAYAHSRGVIHRDLKPSNVMVGAFGEVQVVDWGLAKVLHHGGTADELRAKAAHESSSIIATVRSDPNQRGSDSVAGSVMGTPAYMSPEQARGEVDRLDERGDVFSLGAILCEILTGTPPFPGERDVALTRGANAELGETLERVDGCGADADLIDLCKHCLMPNPSERPRSAEVLAQRLHAHLVSVEERARRAQIAAAQAQVRAYEERKARKLTLALAISVLATVLLGGGGWLAFEQRARHRRLETEQSVVASLADAALARGRQDWPAAKAAVARAQARLEGEEAGDSLKRRVADDASAIRSESESAEAAAALAIDNERLVDQLQDIRQPEGDGIRPTDVYTTDFAALDRTYSDLFARHGLRPDEESVDIAAAAFRARGIGPELAAALDEWASVRREAADEPGAIRLRRIAEHIDPDSGRQHLREAMSSKDLAALRAVASAPDLASQPATTLRLLGGALGAAGDRESSLSVLRLARREHPDDFVLAMLLARAEFAIGPEKAPEAARHLTAALALRPDSIEAWHELGRALAAMEGTHEAALDLLRRAAAHWPRDGHFHYHIALVLQNDGDDKASLRECRLSIEADPNYAPAHNALGNALMAHGDVAGAIAAYRRAIEVDPKHAPAHSNLGVVLVRCRDDLAGGIAEIQLAIKLDPKYARAHANLALALQASRDLPGAIAECRLAIALDPDLAVAHFNLGVNLLESGDAAGAIPAYRRAIELDPKCADAYCSLGNALLRQRDVAGAIAACRLAVELDGTFAKAHHNLGQALAAGGNARAAIEAYQRAIELGLDDPVVHTNLGNAFYELDDLPHAVAEYRRAIDRNAKLALPHNNLALALLQQQDISGAIDECHRALEIDPKLSLAHYNLGKALRAKGDVPGAIASCLRAIELDPQLAGAFNTLGNAYMQGGQPAKAIAAFRRAIELRPMDELYRSNLTINMAEQGDIGGAITAYREWIAALPDSVSALNSFAWLLATCPDEKFRNPEEAVRLASRAVELAPKEGNSWNTLGVALCRQGEHLKCVDALRHSMELRKGGDANDWLFLAISLQSSGNADEAKRWYQQSVDWLAKQPSVSDELQRFREEAARVLGIEKAPRNR